MFVENLKKWVFEETPFSCTAALRGQTPWWRRRLLECVFAANHRDYPSLIGSSGAYSCHGRPANSTHWLVDPPPGDHSRHQHQHPVTPHPSHHQKPYAQIAKPSFSPHYPPVTPQAPQPASMDRRQMVLQERARRAVDGGGPHGVPGVCGERREDPSGEPEHARCVRHSTALLTPHPWSIS